ncbi:DUF5722 domain-containing protein [Marinoscillum furvescens]|uniref:DUF5722 domain-containing protein n=1 Tax=Marinoscillum furvescens DSM 4134 TaxID=1122208 RepID=A0A3D9L1W0_MARFU|nr:DUF5722 domain-containing protein [Marinoscillum furvescens]RED98353.1 hypothetical protein C7460_11023 [Marinoscillum furvescens DSM 4134]
MKIIIFWFTLFAILFTSRLVFAQTDMSFDLQNTNQLQIELNQGVYQVLTTGYDPYVLTQPLRSTRQNQETVLAFEYFCPKGLDHIQIYFGPDIGEGRTMSSGKISATEGWVSHSIDLTDAIKDWGQAGDFLRLDFGRKKDINLQIRNLRLRVMSEREKDIARTREEKRRKEARMELHIKNYLSSDYESEVSFVSVRSKTIAISGKVTSVNPTFLCEISPSMDITETSEFRSWTPIKNGEFEITLDRFSKSELTNYDRLLSKWAVFEKSGDSLVIASHARYADKIVSKYNLPKEKATSKKGLGGFSIGRGHTEDLEKLDITSATVNIWFTRFMFTEPAADRIKHTYQGKSWYFDTKQVEKMDHTFRLTAEKNIITAAILLVSSAEDCPDPKIGKLLQHPDMHPSGIYSMPNMTTPESVECYAAALDFLANRYSREDKKYGRINHWIMHNEVDAGWVWTNMGEKTELIFMDTYIKSMRMCYNIARTYNPHSEVFITLTHYWAWTIDEKFYPSKNLMEILLDYTEAEGDFEWALAHHPYPESLFEPKTWLDQKVDFTFNTPLITFKNIEVIDAWIKQPRALYKGKHKRTLWLSENGTNSRTYSEQDLKEQAAGFAYTWKKLKNLDGIDGFQWHNWFDNRREGGLRIGLRRFPDDEEDPGGVKPVWYVFQAADRKNEDAVFDQYKPLLGIDHWDQVNFIGEIDPSEESQTYRTLKPDTWVATDALGRTLTTDPQEKTAKDRYVGMFYFLTHTKTGGSGPYDVTKIKAANPDNPQWGNGSHFWGEPELGYYLNSEKWVHKKHARMLSDAGVDVIIIDATNNKTYPEAYIPLCEAWREMRAAGEKTPDIAFLGSEISVNTLWTEFYEKGMYPDLWFMWKGKPLLLYGWHEQPSRNKINDVVFSEDIQKFFTLKQSWAWTSLPWYDDGKDEWPWIDHYPQTIGWTDSIGSPEHVPVAAAQHPLSNIGRSFYQFHQPETNKYDLTPVTDRGLFFQEQWDHAIEVDPEFVFVTGWNEWSAGKQQLKEPVNENLLKWNFYPGAHLGKAGKPLKVGDNYFIDQYNQEFSRDIEPMKGGHTDNYYYQLVNNIRKYKGVSPSVEAGKMKSIDLDGGFAQWDEVSCTYYDHIHDTEHRNSPGVGSSGPYTMTSGRNDITKLKVARDMDAIYFYAETSIALTNYTDNNWMLLFIDSDQDSKTGWEGYDLLINHSLVNDSKTTIKKYHKGKWKTIGELDYRSDSNQLMIKVPRNLIGNESASFDFHWVDNPQNLKNISSFFNDGDSAPDRRFNYRFTE